MTRHLLIPAAAVGALAVLGSPAVASTAAPPAAQASKSVKKYFKVFRKAKSRKDVIRLKSGSKRARARLAVANSRLVYSSSEFSVYLVQAGGEICVWQLDTGGATSGCSELAAMTAARPPVLYDVGKTRVVTIVPMLDGVVSATRVAANGSSEQRTVRNNVFVDISAGGGTITWTRGSGAVSVPVLEAGSV